jgi:hypothetical protein
MLFLYCNWVNDRYQYYNQGEKTFSLSFVESSTLNVLKVGCSTRCRVRNPNALMVKQSNRQQFTQALLFNPWSLATAVLGFSSGYKWCCLDNNGWQYLRLFLDCFKRWNLCQSTLSYMQCQSPLQTPFKIVIYLRSQTSRTSVLEEVMSRSITLSRFIHKHQGLVH